MKGRHLIFAIIMGCAAINIAAADDASTARAARRGGTTVSAGTRSQQKGAQTSQQTSSSARGGASVAATATSRTGAAVSNRTAATPETGRSAALVLPRTATQTGAVQTRAATAKPRAATTAAARTAVPRGAVSARAAQSQTARNISRTASQAGVSRAAQTSASLLREQILGRDYKTCRQVYYECMDEFCANKDNQLKRCACSSRIHEFDRTKKQLGQVEDKLLDFNQRLLTVNMDKEDAEALYKATEGENAYNQTKDTSASKKILDEISKKLNSDTNGSFNQNLSAISLSLNTDAAFDNVDSLMGVSTTSKEGVALYNAALPVCREMAAEVCDEESLAMAESGYQMTIEQDCNTVAKTYESQTDQAREKIREGSALLDISRLDIHQKRNSDDILTCKKKMLDQLYDTSVCGENLYKCLDMSGRYIDPSTGQAFLTDDLSNLATLIIRPDMGQKWTAAPGNSRFVTFLDSKKKYLEPAMENCQDISDYVWQEFIEDALAQIKLAQESKLEEVRQSCTTLTTQCLSDAEKSLSDFDARALSTFGVIADKTANEMCADIRNACTALLKNTGAGSDEWQGGMSQIATDKTYETIIQTCREVGRACIIQNCKSISGNFGMCESIQNSVNRKSIINRSSCWADVLECVKSAGLETINNIFVQEAPVNGNFYTELYGEGYQDQDQNKTCYQAPLTKENDPDYIPPKCIYDICAAQCKDVKKASYECKACRLAEKIWGNCEAAPATLLKEEVHHNRILMTQDTTGTATLLAWFAKNTGTDDEPDNCRDTSCANGYTAMLDDNNNIVCYSSTNFSGDGDFCPNDKFNVLQGFTNCCKTDTFKGTLIPENPPKGESQNCCKNPSALTLNKPKILFGGDDVEFTQNICTTASNAIVLAAFDDASTSTTTFLVCITNADASSAITTETSGNVKCNGTFVYINEKGLYSDPQARNGYIYSTYKIKNENAKTLLCEYTNKNWKTEDNKDCGSPVGWSIEPVKPK